MEDILFWYKEHYFRYLSYFAICRLPFLRDATNIIAI